MTLIYAALIKDRVASQCVLQMEPAYPSSQESVTAVLTGQGRGCGESQTNRSPRKQLFWQWPWISRKDDGRPLQQARCCWIPEQLQLCLTQGFGTPAASAEFLIEALHQRLLRRIRDFPKGCHKCFHTCNCGGPAHSEDSIACGRHSIS